MREYLRKMRRDAHMSQQNVAQSIGITRQYYQQIESGERQKKMDVTLLTKLACTFDRPVTELLNKEKGDFNESCTGIERN